MSERIRFELSKEEKIDLEILIRIFRRRYGQKNSFLDSILDYDATKEEIDAKAFEFQTELTNRLIIMINELEIQKAENREIRDRVIVILNKFKAFLKENFS